MLAAVILTYRLELLPVPLEIWLPSYISLKEALKFSIVLIFVA
jgi:hypothetical protein